MLRRVIALAALMIMFAGTTAAPSYAAGSAVCVGHSAANGCSTGKVTVEVTNPDGSTTTVSAGGSPVCRFDGAVIPCSSGGSWWSASNSCYVSAADPQPAKSDPVWQGHTDGTVYDCRLPDDVGGSRHLSQFWSAQPPVNPAEVLQLAARVVTSMHLHAIGVGMAPTPTSVDPSSIGILGLPVWMWAKDPSATTWGPNTGSASSGALTVQVTARAETATWSMGDGTTVVCASPGTPYAPSYGKSESPTCGFAGYQKQGSYSISVVTHWAIEYTSNVGVEGTMALDLTSTASVTIGELQTTVRG